MTDKITEQNNQRAQEHLLSSKFVEAGERAIQEHYDDPEFLKIFSDETTIVQSLLDALEVGNITKEQLVHTLSANRALDRIEKERDPLTGIYNRRGFMYRFREDLALTLRANEDMFIAIVDIDNFKKINDEYGHPYGDAVIQKVAKILKSNSRESDIVARWGGEEFIILMPATNEKGAVFHLENLRSKMPEQVTISAGVAGIVKVAMSEIPKRRFGPRTNTEELINMADGRLYLAKKSGRNKVVSAQNEHEIKASILKEPQ